MRLQSDERLVALTRRGNDAAFETLIARYRVRLLAFCRHMVGSTEDAEDILQEVFVSAYRAMRADERPLNVRPWLYRIARNRSLNHLRRPRPTGVDSMDVFEGGAAVATADRVHDKLDLEDLVDDVKNLPETQRTALMLREMGDLSYDQIAEAMDTSIPSVKSLLVRARVSLAEAAESRRLSCDEVRLELGAVAEGLQKLSSPARRHVADCERCRSFKKELATTNRKLTMLAPVGVFAAMKALAALKIFGGATYGGATYGGATTLGSGAAAGAGAGATAAGGAGAAGAAAAAAGGVAAGGGAAAGAAAGIGAVAAKVGTGLVAAAIVTGGVAQVAKKDDTPVRADNRPAIAAAAPASAAEEADVTGGAIAGELPVAPTADEPAVPAEPTAPVTAPTAEPTAPTEPTSPSTGKPVVDKETTTVVLDGSKPATPGSTTTTEGPGLPTAPPQTVAPPVTAPVTPPVTAPTDPTSGGPSGPTGP